MLVFLRIVSWMLIQISLIKSPRDLGSIDLGATWEPEISTHIAGFFDANKLGSYCPRNRLWLMLHFSTTLTFFKAVSIL